MRIDVAVLGSCVSRDLFNSRFNPTYKDFYDCVLTQNQSSIISLMSEPMTYVQNPADGLSEYQEWNVRSDLTKEFLEVIKEKQPQYLLLDFFADVHFGCMQIQANQFITDNRWMVRKTGYYKSLIANGRARRLTIDEDTEEYLDLWKQHVDKLFAFLKAEVPSCKVVLNQARNADYYIPKSDDEPKPLSTSGKVKAIDATKLNELWDTLDNYVLETYHVRAIHLTHKDFVSCEDHPWGPFYVHYTMDFYHDSMNELHRIVLRDELSAHGDKLYGNMLVELAESNLDKKKLLETYKRKQKVLKRKVQELSKEKFTDILKRKYLNKIPGLKG